jgi:hypothetical protein
MTHVVALEAAVGQNLRADNTALRIDGVVVFVIIATFAQILAMIAASWANFLGAAARHGFLLNEN